jgi:hypothetical protein
VPPNSPLKRRRMLTFKLREELLSAESRARRTVLTWRIPHLAGPGEPGLEGVARGAPFAGALWLASGCRVPPPPQPQPQTMMARMIIKRIIHHCQRRSDPALKSPLSICCNEQVR